MNTKTFTAPSNGTISSSKHPKKSTISTRKGKEPIRSSTKDGYTHNVFFDIGLLHGMRSKVIHDKYPQFENYEYRCFTGALSHVCKYF